MRSTESTDLEQFGCFVGGRTLPASRTMVSVNPASGQPWAVAADATAGDVDEAVVAARRAFQGEWGSLPASERGRLMRQLADRVLADADRLARLETRDNGKVLYQTRGEVAATANWLQYYAGAADKIEGSTIPISPLMVGSVFREPLGVIGAIAPFNAPLVLTSWKLAPALAAGNTVVVKPSPDTPISTLELARLASEVGFPAGVINVVTGGVETGSALVAHPDVAMISFTGDSRTARTIAAAATARMARVSCEGGGKSPHIVFADACLDQALVAVPAGVFTHAGQTCVAGSRLLIERSIFEEFIDRLLPRVRAIRVGDPLAASSHIGALTSQRQLDRVRGYVDLGRDEGAEVLVGGRSPDDAELAAGFFFQPTVIANANNRMRICQEEIFGPVVVALPFDDEDEAVGVANDVPFGLAAGVWTNDIRRAYRVSRRLQAGTVWVNNYRTTHWQVPFGGYKQSGFGRENGLEALREFTQVKAVITDYATETADPFAF